MLSFHFHARKPPDKTQCPPLPALRSAAAVVYLVKSLLKRQGGETVPDVSTLRIFTTAQNLHLYEMDESGHVSNSERWSGSPCCLHSVPAVPFPIFLSRQETKSEQTPVLPH